MALAADDPDRDPTTLAGPPADSGVGAGGSASIPPSDTAGVADGTLAAAANGSGYAAGVATGMLGFAQVFRDANRQGVHDKIAETVVVRERRRETHPEPAPTGHGRATVRGAVGDRDDASRPAEPQSAP